MISRELALALNAAGVRWRPTPGDRFSLLDPAFAGEVFTLSEMTVEAQGPPEAPVLGFNGTTEWALDSVELAAALWLPREDQLRELMGATFQGLAPAGTGFTVTVRLSAGVAEQIAADTAADAYALGVLARIAAANDHASST